MICIAVLIVKKINSIIIKNDIILLNFMPMGMSNNHEINIKISIYVTGDERPILKKKKKKVI